ncbi:DUF5590 domain-containing protein [Sediminibacillus halophilus]|uniref:Uncharacterized protein YpmB n=1 Tax=Sediminibacillus halophilus TaxID=482461 RepID=A0A1G9M0Q8_9BACI|nr:DUF5590 domain-containing protein [Sediminibacillus halophilus]SDL67517.1 Uncharacterized protein YpmB [Sediminibacillus halophilus]
MMEKLSLPFTVPSWVKWAVVIFILVFIGALGYSIYLYNSIQQDKEAGFQTSADRAVAETALEKAENVSRYHGNILYHVVTGTTDDGSEAIAYVPAEQKDGKIVIFRTEDLVSEQSILQSWNNDCSNCELLETNLAIENDQPLLELKYIDDRDRYVLHYYSLTDGSSGDHFRFNRS